VFERDKAPLERHQCHKNKKLKSVNFTINMLIEKLNLDKIKRLILAKICFFRYLNAYFFVKTFCDISKKCYIFIT